MGDKLFCILEASQGPYGKTRMLEFFAFLWQNLWRALWRRGCWISSLQKWLGSWKTGPWLVRAQHVIWCVVRPGHGTTTSAQSDSPSFFLLHSPGVMSSVLLKNRDAALWSISLLFCFVLGGRGQRRRKRQDRAGRSSWLLHGPHPCEVTRVSPSVMDQLTQFLPVCILTFLLKLNNPLTPEWLVITLLNI